jgi:hypothetical protein
MDARSALIRLGLALASLALAGCAALPWPSGADRPRAGTSAAGEGGWLDLRGVVHVHTHVSHDSPGTIGEIVEAAHGAGVDFVALCEHARGATLAPASGEVEGVILIPGWELSVPGGGSLLALGIADRTGLPREPRALVEAIHARGGAAFAAHLERSVLADPERFAKARPDGVEIANLHANANEVRIRLALGQLFLPAPLALRVLVRTPDANLERWAKLANARAIVGGVDAHARFRALGPLGGTVDRYRDVFRLLTTHVRVRERSTSEILAALREGRSYVAFEGLAPVERFEAAREPGGVRVRAPRAARLALVCAGEIASEADDANEALLAWGEGRERCHVEAWLDGEVWIVTSRLD